MTTRQMHDHRVAQVGHLAAIARARELLTESIAVHTRCRLTGLESIQLRYTSRCRRREQVGPVFAGDRSEQPRGDGGFVLVFDDNEAVRETTAEVLVAAGFKVKEARCPDEVVRLLAEADICVVLLDVGLEHQGLAILDRVDDPPPVILMSGDSRDPEDPRHRCSFRNRYRSTDSSKKWLATPSKPGNLRFDTRWRIGRRRDRAPAPGPVSWPALVAGSPRCSGGPLGSQQRSVSRPPGCLIRPTEFSSVPRSLLANPGTGGTAYVVVGQVGHRGRTADQL